MSVLARVIEFLKALLKKLLTRWGFPVGMAVDWYFDLVPLVLNFITGLLRYFGIAV